jgi:glycerate kinase
MSDGGDGFGEVLAGLLKLETEHVTTVDAAHRPCQATWWWGAESRTAVIESARVVGLALLPPKQYHPFQLDTSGLGALLQAAANLGASRHLIGIGGSATNDGGFGLAKALGWGFFTQQDRPILSWTELAALERIEPPRTPLALPEVLVAVDVQNLLLGPEGASRIYGPQKGLRQEDFTLAEAALRRLAEVAREQLGSLAASVPGSGAAGGLGFGLHCFFGARLESGYDVFARHAHLQDRIRSADLVITGEGAIDRSTLMGKGVGEVAKLCSQEQVPCVGLAGTLLRTSGETGPFTQLHGIVPDLAPFEAATSQPEFWLQRLAAETARKAPL